MISKNLLFARGEKYHYFYLGWGRGGFKSSNDPGTVVQHMWRPGIHVLDTKSQNIPEVGFVRRWAVGVLGIWREGVGI
jgi:hypothetical protein